MSISPSSSYSFRSKEIRFILMSQTSGLSLLEFVSFIKRLKAHSGHQAASTHTYSAGIWPGIHLLADLRLSAVLETCCLH